MSQTPYFSRYFHVDELAYDHQITPVTIRQAMTNLVNYAGRNFAIPAVTYPEPNHTLVQGITKSGSQVGIFGQKSNDEWESGLVVIVNETEKDQHLVDCLLRCAMDKSKW